MQSLILLISPACHTRRTRDPSLLYDAARAEFQRGNLAAAMVQTDGGSTQFASPRDVWHWRFLVLKGEIFVWQGRSQDALNLLLDPTPPDFDATDIPIKRAIVQAYANGFLQHREAASDLLNHAMQLAERNQPSLLGEVANAQGTIAILAGDNAQAETDFLRASHAASRMNQSFLNASALGGIGVARMYQDQYGPAIERFQQSLKISQPLGFRTITAKNLGNLGWCYFLIGDYVNAKDFLSQAEDRSVELNLKKDQSIWLTDLGDLFFVEDDYSTANAYYHKSLALAQEVGNQSASVTALQNLALSAIEENRYDDAGKFSGDARAFKQVSSDAYHDAYSTDIEGRIAAGRGKFSDAEASFHRVISGSSNAGLRWASEAHLAELYAQENRPALAQREFQLAIQTIEDARALLAYRDLRLSFLTGAIEFYQDYIDFLISQKRPAEALSVAERSRSQSLKDSESQRSLPASLGVSPADPRKIARAVNGTILFYSLGNRHSWLWAINANQIALYPLPPSEQIDASVQSYEKLLFSSRDVLAHSVTNASALYETLVGPAEELIAKSSRVIILPDGSLYGLNFETLVPSSPQPHFWIEDVTLSEANSLSKLATEAARPAFDAKKLLLIGNPVSTDSRFPQLAQAGFEMQGIEKYFAPSRRVVLSREDATPSAYLQSQPERFSTIHFVAHATASRSAPLESAVILSKEGDIDELYARDIMKKPLRANLVTISACQGAGERTYSGEGLVGLAWAFLDAGARDVIAALWEVDDNSTPQLMESLYDRMDRGADVASALRAAKLSLIHSHTVYRHPFYWAPFILYGP